MNFRVSFFLGKEQGIEGDGYMNKGVLLEESPPPSQPSQFVVPFLKDYWPHQLGSLGIGEAFQKSLQI